MPGLKSPRDGLGDHAAEHTDIENIVEFDAVAESAAGGEKRIAQAHGADGDAEIDVTRIERQQGVV